MKCENCGENKATVHITKIEDNGMIEHHYCEECAEMLNASAANSVNPAELLSSLISQIAPEIKEMATKRCDQCGLTYLEFRSRGRLGCPNDYEVFEKGLTPIIEKIHGASQHKGKTPKGGAGDGAAQSEVLRLRTELEEAVAVEDYERAAKLRDRIHELTGGAA